MNKKFQKSIFIFRRDLRLNDNTGLISALENSESVIPIFIFDEKQIDTKKNKYFSQNAFQFMIESLKDLDEELKKYDSQIFFFKGDYLKILEDFLKNEKIDAVYVNKDFTPFAIKRDLAIEKLCQKNKVIFERCDDYSLSPIEKVFTDQNKKYTIFTPFMRKAATFKVEKVSENKFKNYFIGKLKTKDIKISEIKFVENKNLAVNGGRKNALNSMKHQDFLKDYKNTRNLPAISGTSKLSAHIKFGTVSIREVYHWALKNNSSENFISELYWRDFYLYISLHFPEVFGKSFQKFGDKIAWLNNKKDFEAWKKGETGVPIVDAGMRELNETGWMHNRVRMIVASYLTKNLLTDWRWGEKYFAQKLVDYDPSSNNGGWQWSASVGADPKPIRIFNPYLQVEKYDSKAEYIKKWLPELKEADNLADGKGYDFSNFKNYPKPLISQKESYKRAVEAYKKAKSLVK